MPPAVIADLHTHSTASDGTDSPADVVAAAVAGGVRVLALTDHDTTAGWSAAAAAAREAGIAFLPGVEVSCSLAGISVHLLTYGHDRCAPGLLQRTDGARASRTQRAERMVTMLRRDGYERLTWGGVLARAGAGATIGRPHIADALVAAGYYVDRDDVFAGVLSGRSRFYVPYAAPDALEAIALVREAGGVPVLAHAFARHRGRVIDESAIEVMVGAGLRGLEVEHRDHDEDARHRLRAIARGHDLLVTGSSDYHGSGKRNRIGENSTAASVVEALFAYADGPDVVRPGS